MSNLPIIACYYADGVKQVCRQCGSPMFVQGPDITKRPACARCTIISLSNNLQAEKQSKLKWMSIAARNESARFKLNTINDLALCDGCEEQVEEAQKQGETDE